MAFERPPSLPKCSDKKDFDEGKWLNIEAEEGFKERLRRKFANEEISDSQKQREIETQYFCRLDIELSVILEMNFSGYFLIVSNFSLQNSRNSANFRLRNVA